MMPIIFGNYLPDSFHGPQEEIAGLPKVRVALIGTGLWGKEHARAYTSNPYVELVGIAGRNPERTEKRAAEFSTNAYTDYQEMLKAENPDLVAICLGNTGHFEVTKTVLDSGFAAFVEKPLVFELEQARTLLETAEKNNLFFSINFNHRYAEPFLRSRALLEDGSLGTISFASWRFGGNHDYDFEHPHCQLIETQCHGIDMLLSTIGEIDSVSAAMTDVTGKKGYGSIVLALQFKNGAVGDLCGSYDTSYAYPGTHRFEINGSLGRVLVEDTYRKFTYNKVDDPVSQVWQSTYFDDEARYFAGSHDRHIAQMIHAFRTKKQPPIHARCGYEVLRVCHAAIQSYEQGKRIAVKAVV